MQTGIGMLEIIYLNIEKAQELKPDDNAAIISVMSAFKNWNENSAELQSGWKYKLALAFDDVVPHPGVAESPFYTLMSDKDADRIIDFLHHIKYIPEVTTLYVHCEAGISRSFTIAHFARIYFLNRPNSHRDPNTKHYSGYFDEAKLDRPSFGWMNWHVFFKLVEAQHRYLYEKNNHD